VDRARISGLVNVLVSCDLIFGTGGKSSYAEKLDVVVPPPKPEVLVLVLGDSVMALVGTNKESKDIVQSRHAAVFGARPCQRLVSAGCVPERQKSALQIFREWRGRGLSTVVVTTGYNDYNTQEFVNAVSGFRNEAVRQGVTLEWFTYSEKGQLTLVNWDHHMHQRKGMFSADGVHLSRKRVLYAAEILAEVLDGVETREQLR
jgi:hypothetical protein